MPIYDLVRCRARRQILDQKGLKSPGRAPRKLYRHVSARIVAYRPVPQAFCLWRPYWPVPSTLYDRRSASTVRSRSVQYRTVPYDIVPYRYPRIAAYRTGPYGLLAVGGVRKARLDFDSMSAYCAVPLGAVRYRCRRLATYRAVPISPPRRVPYWPVRTSLSWGEFSDCDSMSA